MLRAGRDDISVGEESTGASERSVLMLGEGQQDPAGIEDDELHDNHDKMRKLRRYGERLLSKIIAGKFVIEKEHLKLLAAIALIVFVVAQVSGGSNAPEPTTTQIASLRARSDPLPPSRMQKRTTAPDPEEEETDDPTLELAAQAQASPIPDVKQEGIYTGGALAQQAMTGGSSSSDSIHPELLKQHQGLLTQQQLLQQQQEALLQQQQVLQQQQTLLQQHGLMPQQGYGQPMTGYPQQGYNNMQAQASPQPGFAQQQAFVQPLQGAGGQPLQYQQQQHQQQQHQQHHQQQQQQQQQQQPDSNAGGLLAAAAAVTPPTPEVKTDDAVSAAAAAVAEAATTTPPAMIAQAATAATTTSSSDGRPSDADMIKISEEIPLLELKNFKDSWAPYEKSDNPIFWHIPKAGGSTIKDVVGSCHRHVMATEFGVTDGHIDDKEIAIVYPKVAGAQSEDRSPFVNVDTTTVAGIERAKNMGFADSGLADCVVTPFLYEANELFTQTAKGRLFAVFRDPVDRAISMFYYLQVATWEPTYKPELQEWTLEQYANSDVVENNWVTRQLSNTLAGDLEDKHLKVAMEVIRRKFLVGIMKKLEKSMTRFEKFFRWKYRVNPPNQETCRERLTKGGSNSNSKNKKSKPKPGEPVWEMLAAQNVFDIQLYEYIETLFDEQEAFVTGIPDEFRSIDATCCKCDPPTFPPEGFTCPKKVLNSDPS